MASFPLKALRWLVVALTIASAMGAGLRVSAW
jgi:hypothetical protein